MTAEAVKEFGQLWAYPPPTAIGAFLIAQSSLEKNSKVTDK